MFIGFIGHSTIDSNPCRCSCHIDMSPPTKGEITFFLIFFSIAIIVLIYVWVTLYINWKHESRASKNKNLVN